MSDSEVRMTAISVRSALIRVRWNDIPVRRAASSVAISPDPDSDVTRRRSRKAAIVFLVVHRPEGGRYVLGRPVGSAVVLQAARVLNLAIEEVAEKRPDPRNRGKMTDFVPGRRKRRANEIGGQLEGQRGHQPSGEVE